MMDRCNSCRHVNATVMYMAEFDQDLCYGCWKDMILCADMEEEFAE